MRCPPFLIAFAVLGCSLQQPFEPVARSSQGSLWSDESAVPSISSSAEPVGPASTAPLAQLGDEQPSEPLIDLSQLTREQLFAHYNRLRGDAYPLDELKRHLDSTADAVSCNREDLVLYEGTELSLIPVVVHPAFAERLERFEHLAIEVAQEVYGRAPRKVSHMGAYVCRKSRFRSRRISEHALGNAIDVLGFDFGPAESDAAAAHLPPGLRWSFQVRVERHWKPRGGAISALHAQFLAQLADRVVQDGVFRVALGPSHRGHHNHFHFDMSPWTYSHL